MGLGGGWGGGDGLQKVGPFLETTCSSVQDDIWWLFLHHEDFGESSAMHFFPPALFFFLKWSSPRAHLFHSLCQDWYTVAQQAETTVAEHFLMSCI